MEEVDKYAKRIITILNGETEAVNTKSISVLKPRNVGHKKPARPTVLIHRSQ